MNDYQEVHDFADGRLCSDGERKARERMNQDPVFRAEVESVQNLKRALQDHCQGTHCAETWAKCKGRLDEVERTEGVNGFVSKFAWQFCGAFIAFILIAGAWTRMSPAANSVDINRASNMAGFSAMANRPSDPYGFQQFLGWKLNGAFQAQIDGRLVIRYELTDSLGPFTVMVADNVSVLDGPCHREVNGLSCYTWIKDNRQFMVIAQRSHDEVVELAKSMGARP